MAQENVGKTLQKKKKKKKKKIKIIIPSLFIKTQIIIN
jgi:hypothetical protein